jgi:hypothetical protein
MPRKANAVIKPAPPELQRRWVKPTSINQYLYCSICTEIFRDPYRLSCGYQFFFLSPNPNPQKPRFLQPVHHEFHNLKIRVSLRPNPHKLLPNAPRHSSLRHNRRNPSLLPLQKKRLPRKHNPLSNPPPLPPLHLQKDTKIPPKPSGQRLR